MGRRKKYLPMDEASVNSRRNKKYEDFVPGVKAAYLASLWHGKKYDLSNREVLTELLFRALKAAYRAGSHCGIKGYLRRQEQLRAGVPLLPPEKGEVSPEGEGGEEGKTGG